MHYQHQICEYSINEGYMNFLIDSWCITYCALVISQTKPLGWMTQNDDTNDTISCSVSKVRQENAII